MLIWTFVLNLSDLNIHATIKEITLRIMLGSIPHQKFCFYHLPTRRRAGIKLGDAWYVSNVYIIFNCSMLLYYLLWMFMGFNLHFYIIFGTNLLTGGPARIVVFFLFQCFEEKEYQTRSKRNETFESVIFWNKRDLDDLECMSTSSRGGHEGARRAPYRWARPHPRGPLEHPPTYFFLLHIPMYPENIRSDHKKLFPPP